MITGEPSTSFGRLAEQARDLCSAQPALNLMLALRAPISAVDDAFLDGFRDRARLWLSKDRPARFWFNHGEFIHRHGDGVEYLISQLQRKPTGNRACISLLNTADFIASADDPLPSFLLLQAGFAGGGQDVLYLTAYYRALEVGSFLPINLAEMALVASEASTRIPTITELDLTIHAFRAHYIPDFQTLHRSDLDAASVDDIRAAVQDRDIPRLVAWLTEQTRPASIIDTSGTATLLTELNASDWANGDLLRSLEVVVASLTQLQEARRNGSHAPRIDALQEQVGTALEESIRILRQSKLATGGH